MASNKTEDKNGQTTRLVIIEDDDWLRQNLADEVSAVKGFECVGTYPTAEEALEAVPALAPDVAVVDINLPGINGIECLRRLKPACPQTQFLILTVYEESESIFNALLAGADGYLLKRSSTEEILEAIRQVREGGSPMSGHIARRVVQYFNQKGAGRSDVDALSPREREVLELLSRGESYKGIAGQLELSIHTVRMNVRAIYTKLHVHSRGEAVAKFLGQG